MRLATGMSQAEARAVLAVICGVATVRQRRIALLWAERLAADIARTWRARRSM